MFASRTLSRALGNWLRRLARLSFEVLRALLIGTASLGPPRRPPEPPAPQTTEQTAERTSEV